MLVGLALQRYAGAKVNPVQEPAMPRFLLLTVLAPLVCPPLAKARLLASWPYKKLLKEADVVVIVKKEAKVGLPRHGYLLFLKKGEGGRYEPVSGQVDPQFSERKQSGPQPDASWNGDLE
jgi:hypothetical protein